MIHLVGHGMVGYRTCSNCVMDTSDSRIQFDANGVCDHCRGFTQHVLPHWHPGRDGQADVLRRWSRRSVARARAGSSIAFSA